VAAGKSGQEDPRHESVDYESCKEALVGRLAKKRQTHPKDGYTDGIIKIPRVMPRVTIMSLD
jgi:hypothetical protein